MVSKRIPENIELGDFLEAAGKSLGDAQNSLLSGLNLSTNIILNNADIEVKVLVDSANGKISIKPVSAEDIRVGSIDPGLLSTLRISYVSTLEEPTEETVSPTVESVKEPSQMIEQVLNRRDIQKLAATKGELQVKPTFVAERQRWLVSIEDSGGKVLREIVLPDA
ncbi:MAG: hypothetical protein JW762_15900 [Dehalococcoidales bacterium]|nr:hypothetical protein [Dehalococcoidales bacterium]